MVMVTTEESTSVMDAVRSSSKTRSSKLTSAKSPVVTEPGKYKLFTHYNLASLDLLLCVEVPNCSTYYYSLLIKGVNDFVASVTIIIWSLL